LFSAIFGCCAQNPHAERLISLDRPTD